MNLIQVKAIPADQKTSVPHLVRDFKAALSYVSFYSSDSPFVIQAVAKCHRTLQVFLQVCGSLVLRLEKGRVMLNDADVSDIEDLSKILQDKDIQGVQFVEGFTALELTSWIKHITLPVNDPNNETGSFSHIRVFPKGTKVEIIKEEAPLSSPPMEVAHIPSFIASAPMPPFQPPAPVSSEPRVEDQAREDLSMRTALNVPAPGGPQTQEALLSFVAEAWQHAQLQKKNAGASPEMNNLTESFDRLFDRLLDRMEKTSPEFSNIHQWFSAPQGSLLETQVSAAMVPLLESAVKNEWMAVLFDPATEGLVGECLAYWGANGKEELVEKTVGYLAERLGGDAFERQLALAHLMDARPWVRNAPLLKKVLSRLNKLLAEENSAGLYQTALLLAWDLVEPALAWSLEEEESLNLLAILHFHTDDESAPFPERQRIARYWLFERSTPDLIRRFAFSAQKAGRLSHFPLLGEMAAPILLEDFLTAPATEKSSYLWLFGEMKEPLRSVLALRLAEAVDDDEVRRLIPVLRVCGMDPALSLQLSAWIGKGSRELKLNLLGVIEEVGDPAGGPALRLALFDDAEEVAALAARIIGKIRFTPGLPVLLKAAKIREKRYSQNDEFLTATCRSLGDLKDMAGVPFLEEIARKKTLLRGRNYPLPLRQEAVQALAQVNQPQVWSFLGSLMEEKNPPLQETLDKIIHEKIETM